MSSNKKHTVEVCLTPAIYNRYHNPDSIVVIVDILRATTSMVTAFMNGANKLIPIGSLDEARAYKAKGFLVAAERDGIVRDFADFGNCPSNFSKEQVQGKDIVYTTTNGTQTIHLAKGCYKIAIGAYINLSALAAWIIKEKHDLVILCAGWKDKFSLEDTLFAGALIEKVLSSEQFETICDSTHASVDLWKLAKGNLLQYIEKAANRHRLRKNGVDQSIEYCHTLDLTDIIPVFHDYYLTPIK
jgi:2-phosphosulfolactate phosphatase